MSSILNNRDQRGTTTGVIQENLLIRLLLLSSVLGPSLFTVVYTIEGAGRPGYDPWLQAVSSLSLSDQGWMQVDNFIISGLLVLGFALGLRRTLCSGEGAMWGPGLDRESLCPPAQYKLIPGRIRSPLLANIIPLRKNYG